MRKWQYYISLVSIYLVIWFVPPIALGYYVYYYTNLYAFGGYSFQSVIFAFWALWSIAFFFIAWVLSNVLEGMLMGKAIVESIQREELDEQFRELKREQQSENIQTKLENIQQQLEELKKKKKGL